MTNKENEKKLGIKLIDVEDSKQGLFLKAIQMGGSEAFADQQKQINLASILTEIEKGIKGKDGIIPLKNITNLTQVFMAVRNLSLSGVNNLSLFYLIPHKDTAEAIIRGADGKPVFKYKIRPEMHYRWKVENLRRYSNRFQDILKVDVITDKKVFGTDWIVEDYEKGRRVVWKTPINPLVSYNIDDLKGDESGILVTVLERDGRTVVHEFKSKYIKQAMKMTNGNKLYDNNSGYNELMIEKIAIRATCSKYDATIDTDSIAAGSFQKLMKQELDYDNVNSYDVIEKDEKTYTVNQTKVIQADDVFDTPTEVTKVEKVIESEVAETPVAEVIVQAPVETNIYKSMKKLELQTICDERNINTKGLIKQKVIEALTDYDENPVIESEVVKTPKQVEVVEVVEELVVEVKEEPIIKETSDLLPW